MVASLMGMRVKKTLQTDEPVKLVHVPGEQRKRIETRQVFAAG
jgi:hypothetical protein